MRKKARDRYVLVVIESSTIKKFVLLDLVTGMSLYFLLKVVGVGIILSSVGSFFGTEGIRMYDKKNYHNRKKEVKTKRQLLM